MNQRTGPGTTQRSEAYNNRLDTLFDCLREVKHLYEQKYGTSVDAEDLEEHVKVQDGVQGISVVGVGAARRREAYAVKDLCECEDGESVDTEERFKVQVEVPGIVCTGPGIMQHIEAGKDRVDTLYDGLREATAYNNRLDTLFDRLHEVKNFYEQKYGARVDAEDLEEHLEEQDGVQGSSGVGAYQVNQK